LNIEKLYDDENFDYHCHVAADDGGNGTGKPAEAGKQ
jgi:hypothetical protein